MSFIASNRVFVFPNTLRNQNQRVFNEQNMIRYANRHEKESYVISYNVITGNEHNFRFLLAGYLFDIKLTDTTVKNKDVYAHILLESISQGGSDQHIEQLYGIDDGTNFTGLYIDNNNEADNSNFNGAGGRVCSLQLITANGDIPPDSLYLQHINGGTC